MAEWHLNDLRNGLEQRGWRIESVPGDDYRVSATWKIQRAKKFSVLIDFDGLDDLVTLPIEQSYSCHVRDCSLLALSFRKRGERGSMRRKRWSEELEGFLNALDDADVE